MIAEKRARGNKDGNARTPLTVYTSLGYGKKFRGVSREMKLWMEQVGNVLWRICFKHHKGWLVETSLKSFKSSIKSSQEKTLETFVQILTFRIEDKDYRSIFCFIWYSWYIVNTFLSGGIQENFTNTQRYYTYEKPFRDIIQLRAFTFLTFCNLFLFKWK